MRSFINLNLQSRRAHSFAHRLLVCGALIALVCTGLIGYGPKALALPPGGPVDNGVGTLHVSPSVARPGETITISGEGFEKRADGYLAVKLLGYTQPLDKGAFQISWPKQQPQDISEVTNGGEPIVKDDSHLPNAQGSFSFNVTLPTHIEGNPTGGIIAPDSPLPDGKYQIRVLGSNPILSRGATLIIESKASSPSPAPNTPPKSSSTPPNSANAGEQAKDKEPSSTLPPKTEQDSSSSTTTVEQNTGEETDEKSDDKAAAKTLPSAETEKHSTTANKVKKNGSTLAKTGAQITVAGTLGALLTVAAGTVFTIRRKRK